MKLWRLVGDRGAGAAVDGWMAHGCRTSDTTLANAWIHGTPECRALYSVFCHVFACQTEGIVSGNRRWDIMDANVPPPARRSSAVSDGCAYFAGAAWT